MGEPNWIVEKEIKTTTQVRLDYIQLLEEVIQTLKEERSDSFVYLRDERYKDQSKGEKEFIYDLPTIIYARVNTEFDEERDENITRLELICYRDRRDFRRELEEENELLNYLQTRPIQ